MSFVTSFLFLVRKCSEVVVYVHTVHEDRKKSAVGVRLGLEKWPDEREM